MPVSCRRSPGVDACDATQRMCAYARRASEPPTQSSGMRQRRRLTASGSTGCSTKSRSRPKNGKIAPLMAFRGCCAAQLEGMVHSFRVTTVPQASRDPGQADQGVAQAHDLAPALLRISLGEIRRPRAQTKQLKPNAKPLIGNPTVAVLWLWLCCAVLCWPSVLRAFNADNAMQHNE